MAFIFIVEDDADIREIEKIALKNSNYEVKAFENAKDFYKKLKETIPDLVILDVMLPDESGYEIVKKLRLHEAPKKIPESSKATKRGNSNWADHRSCKLLKSH